MQAKATDEEIRALFGQGLGATTISRQLKIDPSRVTRRLQRMGLSRPTTFVPSSAKLELELKANPKNAHKAAEHFARFWFALRGCEIYQPEADSCVDLLVVLDGSFKRVQVKSSSSTNKCGNLIFNLSRSKFNTKGSWKVPYKSGECDFFFLFGVSKTKAGAWLVPFHLLEGVGQVSPAGKLPGFKVW